MLWVSSHLWIHEEVLDGTADRHSWEDVVKEVARHFDTQVHVDRYKNSIYSAVRSDPFLSACTTTDPSATRFHACERWAKCEACRTFNAQGDRVWNKGKRVVHVNMVEVKSASWVLEREAFVRTLTSAAIGEGDWPFNIVSCHLYRRVSAGARPS